PEFMAGEEIVIDPAVQPKDEHDFVLVRMAANDEHLFRRYRPRGKSAFDLVAENSAWKTVSVTDAASVTILGTMIEHRRRKHRVVAVIAPRIPAAADHAADAIVALINSRVQSPTKGELVGIILAAPLATPNNRLTTVNEIVAWLGGPTGAADRTGLTAGE